MRIWAGFNKKTAFLGQFFCLLLAVLTGFEPTISHELPTSIKRIEVSSKKSSFFLKTFCFNCLVFEKSYVLIFIHPYFFMLIDFSSSQIFPCQLKFKVK